MTIHDHFGGSGNCVECQGPCQLTGYERGATEMVRWALERLALNGWKRCPDFEADAIRKLGADPRHMMCRAVACCTEKPDRLVGKA
jgi:hypothetical protein